MLSSAWRSLLQGRRNTPLFWDAFWSENDHSANPAYMTAVELLPDWPKAFLLDAGCGCGCGIGLFANRRPGWEFMGVDFSEEAIGTARGAGIKGATFSVGALEVLEPRNVDVVVMVHVVENLDDPFSVVVKFLRRCRVMIIVSPFESQAGPGNGYTHLVTLRRESFDELRPAVVKLDGRGDIVYVLRGALSGGA